MITPPPELVRQWAQNRGYSCANELWEYLATQAAQWGADQELNECCHLLRLQGFDVVDDLRAARRPKPPSLKAQALDELDLIPTHDNEGRTLGVDVSIIRRALEQLDD